jgi:hypothetical protein
MRPNLSFSYSNISVFTHSRPLPTLSSSFSVWLRSRPRLSWKSRIRLPYFLTIE